MKQYNFLFENRNSYFIKLTSYGLSFNAKCVQALDFAEKINIGIDRENKAMIVKPSASDGYEKEYFFVTSENKKKGVAITARKLVDELLAIMCRSYLEWGGMSLSAIKKDNTLIVDLSNQN